MSDLLTAARQALPGLEWHCDGIAVAWAYPEGGAGRVGINGRDGNYHAYLRDRSDHHKTPEAAAQWLRAQVTARRDALDAALGEPKHLGTSARDWCGMWDVARLRADAAEAKLKAVVATWPAHYHRQGCPWGACNCGADAANAARVEARRLCGVGNG